MVASFGKIEDPKKEDEDSMKSVTRKSLSSPEVKGAEGFLVFPRPTPVFLEAAGAHLFELLQEQARSS